MASSRPARLARARVRVEGAGEGGGAGGARPRRGATVAGAGAGGRGGDRGGDRDCARARARGARRACELRERARHQVGLVADDEGAQRAAARGHGGLELRIVLVDVVRERRLERRLPDDHAEAHLGAVGARRRQPLGDAELDAALARHLAQRADQRALAHARRADDDRVRRRAVRRERDAGALLVERRLHAQRHLVDLVLEDAADALQHRVPVLRRAAQQQREHHHHQPADELHHKHAARQHGAREQAAHAAGAEEAGRAPLGQELGRHRQAERRRARRRRRHQPREDGERPRLLRGRGRRRRRRRGAVARRRLGGPRPLSGGASRNFGSLHQPCRRGATL